MEPPKTALLHSASALIAIALGLIYGFGAITIYGQIAREGVDAVQLMGLIPVEQILSRGIGSIISQFDQILIALGFSAPFFWIETGRETGGGESADLALPRYSRAVVVLIAILLALTTPMKEAVVTLIALFVTVATVTAIRRIRDRNQIAPLNLPLSFLIGGLVMVFFLNIGTAVIQPAPLPVANLEMRDDSYRSGRWITTTDGSWYLARKNGTIASVSTREVVGSEISYPRRDPEQSVLEWSLGLPPPNN